MTFGPMTKWEKIQIEIDILPDYWNDFKAWFHEKLYGPVEMSGDMTKYEL